MSAGAIAIARARADRRAQPRRQARRGAADRAAARADDRPGLGRRRARSSSCRCCAAAGLRWREFWIRTLPIWIAAPLAGLTIALYGATSGEIYVEWFVVRISEGSLTLALATFFRVLAIGLPAVVLFVTVDPTDLADGLAQLLKLPARFVLGALAGMRLLGLLTDDWRALALARRARGVADTGRVRRVLGMAFALFVLSIRRGSTLATAMEARGFGGTGPRTWARESRFGWREWMLLAVGAAISATAIAVAVADRARGTSSSGAA